MSVDASLDRYLGILAACNPELHSLLHAKSEDDFVEAVEAALERSFVRVEAGAKRYGPLDERGLSGLLADLLSASGFCAVAEQEHNGHVDVVVSCAWGRGWIALAECKIYDGYQYHLDGCGQLLGYCAGRQKRVFTVDFFKVRSMYEKLDKMMKRFNSERPLLQVDVGTAKRFRGSFSTPHRHEKSGATVDVVHYGVNLHI
jgi:hypothetical protein